MALNRLFRFGLIFIFVFLFTTKCIPIFKNEPKKKYLKTKNQFHLILNSNRKFHSRLIQLYICLTTANLFDPYLILYLHISWPNLRFWVRMKPKPKPIKKSKSLPHLLFRCSIFWFSQNMYIFARQPKNWWILPTLAFRSNLYS